MQIQELLADKLDEELSDRTVEYIWQVLNRALKVAVRWELIPRIVAELVTPPRPSIEEVVPMELTELKAVLGAARGHRFEASFVIALTTGLRRGEILALKTTDIDLDGETPTLRVKGSLQRIDGALHITEPKSAKSRRTIALSAIAIEALRHQKVRQAEARLKAGETWQDTGLVFTTATGTPIDPRNFLRQWYRLLDKAGVERRPLHHARHTAASVMLSEGLPLKVVQETLGHSTIQLTADRYGHLMAHDNQRVAEAMNRALGA